MLTVSDVQALIVITLGDAFVLNRRVRQHTVLPQKGGVMARTCCRSAAYMPALPGLP